MSYSDLRQILATNQISLQMFASEIGLTPEGLKRGLDKQSLAMRYIIPLCKSLCITPNRFFGISDGGNSQVQNGGLGNTQNMVQESITLREQLRIKDEQIATLLDIIKNK